jgi:hypothetical protein
LKAECQVNRPLPRPAAKSSSEFFGRSSNRSANEPRLPIQQAVEDMESCRNPSRERQLAVVLVWNGGAFSNHTHKRKFTMVLTTRAGCT